MIRMFASAALIAGLAVAACAQDYNPTPETKNMTAIPAAKEISVQETHELKASDAVALVDVRRESEWRDTGMAEGAIGATLQDDDFLEQVLAVVGGDKSKPVALICRSGGRSAKAQKMLEADGYTTVINVAGGTLDWIKQDLPLQEYAAD